MKALVIGGGGREHALAWKLAQSARLQTIFVAPGNAGTAIEPRVRNVAITDLDELAEFAVDEKIDLTVVGPEAALAAGAVDRFRAKGLRIFGPTRVAAELESSKSFAKEFMQRHAIPTAAYKVFDDAAAAHAHVDEARTPIVVKADGLAAGKGVVVAATRTEAHAAIETMLGGAAPAGSRVLPLASSQDHKRIGDADTGANTGGMGAYSPAPVVTPNVHARALHEIVLPTIAGLAAEGRPFVGFLYAGLMIDSHGTPRTVEFNCRLGDPEAQVILMRLKTDLFDLLMQATAPSHARPLDTIDLHWDRRVALGVVMAAANYPGTPKTGDIVSGVGDASDGDIVKVFHAGTTLRDGSPVTAGGRVLCVTALGESTRQAQQHAYHAVEKITFAGAQWRTDIGQRALRRLTP